MALTVDQVFRDYVTAGVPGSGTHQPSKSEIRALLNGIQAGLSVFSPIAYIFDTATADADPGAGKVRLNNVDVTLATAAYLDDANEAGVNIGAVLDSWGNSDSTIKGQLLLTKSTDPSVFHAYSVVGLIVDGTGYRKLTLSYVGGAGAFAADDVLLVQFLARGDMGPPSTFVDPGSPRNKLQYVSATTVRIYGKYFPMGGCRVFGQYFKSQVPTFETAGFYTDVSTDNDLAFGTTVKLENWQAVFALANDGDPAPTFKIAPFLYIKSRDVNDVLTLGKCGEQHGVGAGTIDDATYSWAVDELVGAEVLVISDRPEASVDAAFAPRMTTVTANNATTITLADVGEVRDKSMLLLVPKGFDHYRYCAPFYFDTAEIRNIYDTGTMVGSRMVNLAFYHENDGGSVSTWLNGSFGSGASAKKLDCQRFISPLATAIVFQERCQLATSSAVETSSFMDVDGSNHYIGVHRQSKATGSSGPEVTSYSSEFQMPFFRGQNYRNWNSGGGASSRYDVQHNINGWIEA